MHILTGRFNSIFIDPHIRYPSLKKPPKMQHKLLPLLFILIHSSTIFAQTDGAPHFELTAVWGEGNCRAVIAADGYILAGNGAFLTILTLNSLDSLEVISKTLMPGSIQALYINGNLIYTAAHDQVLIIADITNPAHPTIKGGLDAPYLVDNILYNDNYIHVYTDKNIYSLDVSDPSDPLQIDNRTVTYHILSITLNSNHLFVSVSEYMAGYFVYIYSFSKGNISALPSNGKTALLFHKEISYKNYS